jgi:hypothetical protein
MLIRLVEAKATTGAGADRTYGRAHHSYAIFRFEIEGAQSWTGAFALTGVSSVTLAREFDDGRHVIVVAQGQGYVVDGLTGALRHLTEGDDFTDALAVPGTALMALAGMVEIVIVDTNGWEWVSEQIALDGIALLGADSATVQGAHWQPDGWYRFSVNLVAPAVHLGEFISSHQDAISDPGINHPAPVLGAPAAAIESAPAFAEPRSYDNPVEHAQTTAVAEQAPEAGERRSNPSWVDRSLQRPSREQTPVTRFFAWLEQFLPRLG